jgi:hypothetical protein
LANNRGLGELNELARTGAVKAADIRMVQESEDALRDVLGFSHPAAKPIAQLGFKWTANNRRGSPGALVSA